MSATLDIMSVLDALWESSAFCRGTKGDCSVPWCCIAPDVLCRRSGKRQNFWSHSHAELLNVNNCDPRRVFESSWQFKSKLWLHGVIQWVLDGNSYSTLLLLKRHCRYTSKLLSRFQKFKTYQDKGWERLFALLERSNKIEIGFNKLDKKIRHLPT